MESPLSTSWTEAQVRRLLANENIGYQKIRLPFGLETPGDDRSGTVRSIFPADLTGKTVLDVGSLNGYFCFEALRRGAHRAVGVEVNPESVRVARLLAECLGLPAEFIAADFERENVAGPFDFVLCLNVLHHLKNPLSALEKLIALTRERLVLEVASIGRHDRRKLRLSPLSAHFVRRAPVLYVADTRRRSGQKFFLTRGALETLLLSHHRVFASVDFKESEHKDRFIAVAHRRQIGHLVVVSGPTSAGKSTLIRKLLSGQLPAVEQELGLDGVGQWSEVTGGGLATFRQAQVPGLLFHYDFLHPYFKSAKTHARDELLDVLDCAERLSFLTVWAPLEILQRQLEQSEILPQTRRGVFRGNKRHWKIREYYRDADRVNQFYRDWFAFTRTKPGRHYVVSLAGKFQLRPLAEWEAEQTF